MLKNTSVKTGIRTHTLPIRNTRAWIRCSLLLGCDKSLSSISFHLTASFIPQSQFAIGLRESLIQSSRYFWPGTQGTSCGWQVFFFNWEGVAFITLAMTSSVTFISSFSMVTLVSPSAFGCNLFIIKSALSLNWVIDCFRYLQEKLNKE